MSGEPTYTDEWADEWSRVRGLAQAAMTAARSRIKFARIVAAAVDVTASTGHRIILNPEGDDKPAIWLIPSSGGGNVSKIRSLDNVNPGEAVLSITSGVNAANTASAELQLGSGSVRMQIHDASGTGNNGGFADWAENYARFGYLDGSNDNYFHFSANTISRHVGQWDDFGSQFSDAGLLWGSFTVGGSSTNITFFYPGAMQSNMGPIPGLRTGSGAANTRWSITASNTDYVEIRWDTAQSVAIYLLSFRH